MKTPIKNYSLFILMFLLPVTAFANPQLHKKVIDMLSKHTLTETNGRFLGYETHTKVNYSAQQCELQINRKLQWKNVAAATTEPDHGATYKIPLNKIAMERGNAINRIKLTCAANDGECIAQRLHKSCEGKRNCRQERTVSAYYLQVMPNFKDQLAQQLGQLVKTCATTASR